MSARPKKPSSKSVIKGTPEEIALKLEAALTEIDSLRRELAYRDETIQRMRTNAQSLKEQLEKTEKKLGETEQDKKEFVLSQTSTVKDFSSNKRKHWFSLESHLHPHLELKLQSLNSERETETSRMQVEIQRLLEENNALTTKLKATEEDFRRTVEEKDAMIEEQGTHISCMATEFESMLNETIEKIGKKLQEAAAEWTGDISLTPASQKLLNEMVPGS